MIMNKIKESGVATGLRITFAVIMVITVGIFTNCVVLQNTILNQKFWKRTIMSEDIRDAFKDELNEQIKDYVRQNQFVVDGESISLDDIDTGDEFTNELVDFAIDEIMDTMLTGKVSVDEDRFDEIFDEYGDEFFDAMEEQGLSREEFMESKDQLFDEINESLEEIHDEMEETEVYEMFDLEKYKTKNIITMIITGVLNVAMIVTLIILHKNKFRPVRAIGISITVTEITSLIGWFIIWGIVKASGTAAMKSTDDEFVSLLFEAALNSIGKVLGIFGIATAIGIVLIIGGCVGAGLVSSSYRKKHPVAAPAYTAPVYTAPVAPAAPVAPVSPVTPVTPVAPVAPVTPVTPVTPVAPTPAPVPAPQADTWTCPGCGNTGITTKFCNMCGTKKPE